MSKADKLMEKARATPQNIRFSELCKLAELYGFALKGGKGSHRVYTRKGVPEILTVQDVNGMAKPYQVKQFLKVVEAYGLKGE
jgi:hypothetical protein